MGISKEAFQKTQGFRNIHPGEDPDLALRIREMGFETAYAEGVFVYHKRRTSWKSFAIQVYKFGLARTVLNHWHPKSRSWVYALPSVFLLAFLLSLLLAMFSATWFLELFLVYAGLLFLESLIRNRSITVAILALPLASIQMFGYGYGYLKGVLIRALNRKKKIETLFPVLFWPKKK